MLLVYSIACGVSRVTSYKILEESSNVIKVDKTANTDGNVNYLHDFSSDLAKPSLD